MENDSKLGMIAGLAVVLAVAVLAAPKLPDAPAPEAKSFSPAGSVPASPSAEFSLTSQTRDSKVAPAIIVPLRKGQSPE